ncbi:MAG: hypothetical protein OXI05_08210 [Bacteroidota bacterium]|nr:hypothetical protein [Bacteroidota bacterium]
MNYLLSFACMCLFLLPGKTYSQLGSDIEDYILASCNGCTTIVIQYENSWDMSISCEGSSKIHIYEGTGAYGGAVCGQGME